MENGSQIKRPLDDKAEEVDGKVLKQETMQTPIEQREGQDPDSTDNKTSVPEPQKQSDTSDMSEQTATAVPRTKAEASTTDKQSKPRSGFSFKSISIGFGGKKDERSTLASF